MCVWWWIVGVAGFMCSSTEAAQPAGGQTSILERIGVTSGICVLLDDIQCKQAIELAQETELLVYVQLSRAHDLTSARRAADEAGYYGRRIFVEHGPLNQLYPADNLADVVVATGEPKGLNEAEVLRVLRPGGKAILGQKMLAKPVPTGVDDWSHPYHGPDNNPQSNDQVARGPYLTQFLAEPRYGPLPQVAVASAGRVFKAFGHIAFKVREEPLLNTLAAFNGYNGTLLWKRELSPKYMIHRNTIIATPATLYVADDKSCKLIDPETGKLLDEIIPPVETAGGTFWKWMGLEDGVLYALTGEQEQVDPIVRQKRQVHGWPWVPLSPGFDRPNYPWGYGRNLLAIEPKTKRILWRYHENEPIDSRAVCMKNGRIYFYRFGEYLGALNAKTGKVIWRKTKKNAPALFAAMGEYLNRCGPWANWRSTVYLKCSDEVLYFAGPQAGKLLAVSAKDGRVLWEDPYNNFQLVLRDEGLYGFSGTIDHGKLSKKFNPLTGEVLAELVTGRRTCTRPTGAVDAIFYRAEGGSTRFDTTTNHAELISPMRAQCHDGVTIANGLLYWWPSVCDCNLTLYGITCLGPAGRFDFSQNDGEADRLEKGSGRTTKVTPLPQSSSDWPTFRADNLGSATSRAVIAKTGDLLWQYTPDAKFIPTTPVAAGGLVFYSGADGIVRAIDAQSGRARWKAYTGGAVRIAPTIWRNRVYVGSGDGWIYALEAATGRLLWRFRAAPKERRIPVYGSLLSTWPVASGVLVQNGVAYAAAGIVNYDGTHVYALDAISGRIIWQNHTSGHLDTESRCGVSVQGHMLICRDKLCLAGGNAVSPAIYNIKDGTCMNNPEKIKELAQNNVRISQSPFYAHPQYKVYDNSVLNKTFVASQGNLDIVWVNNTRVMCFTRTQEKPNNRFLEAWGKLDIPGMKPVWQYDCPESMALAAGKNAVVVAKARELAVLNLRDGQVLWSKPLPARPVEWGLAINDRGQIFVTLEDGRILCFGEII